MHTATQLAAAQFAISISDASATLADLFPKWTPEDRLGVVIHEPLGALGASHLIQLAIVAYYDARPSRRAGKLERGNPLAVYPEIYVFHVGAQFGDHRWLDVFPARKEVRVADDPAVVVEALNDRAITRLAVPDGCVSPVELPWKEPAAARDRIRASFAYSATGSVGAGDVTLVGLSDVTQENVSNLLASSETHGVSAQDVARARGRRAALSVDGTTVETLRRIDLEEALASLVPIRRRAASTDRVPVQS